MWHGAGPHLDGLAGARGEVWAHGVRLCEVLEGGECAGWRTYGVAEKCHSAVCVLRKAADVADSPARDLVGFLRKPKISIDMAVMHHT